MTLKKTDQDIPKNLVAKYNGNSKSEVDKGHSFCLPLLFLMDENVTKTDKGFHADYSGSLGLVILRSKKSSDFDKQGILSRHCSSSSILTPLVLGGSDKRVSTDSFTGKNINRDIPAALVKKYNESTYPYLEESDVSLLLLLLTGNKSLTKTEAGYQASSSINIGLLIASGSSFADYNTQGELIKYRESGSFFTPLIYRRCSHKTKEAGTFKKSSSVKFLAGSFGYERKKSGAKNLVFLWIPIPIEKEDSTT